MAQPPSLSPAHAAARLTGAGAYAIKAALADPQATAWHFLAQKTMYGGKLIRPGDTLFIFDSETEGGSGLVACGVVTAAEATPRQPGMARQTPRVSIHVRRTARARLALGRRELKAFDGWKDGRPQTELNFKFYRQATNKIVGLTDTTAAWLLSCF